ncbi:hypothetical protein C1645_825828 [Glomus cerebriforme]|uniref:Uncharacterized protein n=1 Tax=Glomus cerebriforme TaxID=658196 RepID=A0A397SXS5_9GLOM|nr:hypothetical protein C1645_825828 [Glomus cerebriforme]
MNTTKISFPLPSLFLSDDEININKFELKKLSLENFNEILDNYFEIENEKNNYDIFEEQDKIIDHLKNVEFISCVVIDFIKGKTQQCEETMKLRQLRNLFGTWQVDKEAINEVDGKLSRLEKDFDTDTIKRAILSKLNPRCLDPSPDIVILKLGANPNSDEEILQVAEMYKEDFSTHLKFEEKLHHCSSFKIPNENLKNMHHIYFRFNEALETFGMKFIKQHISENVIDEKNRKDQIKDAQDKRERIDLLMSEYLNDHSISYSK